MGKEVLKYQKMINTIIKAIGISIKTEFDEENYEIYTEETEQVQKCACFFIACLSQKQKLFLGKRYFSQKQFKIQYFPATENVQQECNAIAQRLNDCLEYITITDESKPLRGTHMGYEIIENVLNFYVNYDYFIYKEELKETMGVLEASINLKEES